MMHWFQRFPCCYISEIIEYLWDCREHVAFGVNVFHNIVSLKSLNSYGMARKTLHVVSTNCTSKHMKIVFFAKDFANVFLIYYYIFIECDHWQPAKLAPPV